MNRFHMKTFSVLLLKKNGKIWQYPACMAARETGNVLKRSFHSLSTSTHLEHVSPLAYSGKHAGKKDWSLSFTYSRPIIWELTFSYCFGLNICPPPPNSCWNPNAQSGGIRKWGPLGSVLSHEVDPSYMGLMPYKKAPERSQPHSFTGGHSKKAVALAQRPWSWAGIQNCEQ